ncbi:MAG: hypothetical protein KDA55_09245, partial [Planctomycetales bacterium]|nr:hypothetical protein [Planctomycetales bacterium]
TKIHTVRLSANMTRLLMLDPPTPTLRLNGKFRARQQSLTRRRPQWSSAADSGWDWLVDGGRRMSKTELPLRSECHRILLAKADVNGSGLVRWSDSILEFE